MNITVAVLSYNSELFIEECLDSALGQDYDLSLLNLIISDDGSKDGTKIIIERWVLRNKDKFNSVLFLSKEKNAGTVLNALSVLEATQTKWLKMIGADDFFDRECFSEFARFSPADSVSVVVSNFRSVGVKSKVMPDRMTKAIISYTSKSENDKALFLLMLGAGNIAPGAFINAEMLKKNGGFDVNYFLLEDLPLWDKLIRKGCVFAHLDKVTVYYRIHDAQTVGSKISGKMLHDMTLYAEEISRRGLAGKVLSLHRRYNLFIASGVYRFDFSRVFLLYLNPINVLIKMIKH